MRAGIGAVAVLAAAIALGGGSAGAAPGSPNIVLIMTDDQAAHEFERWVMPQTNALIRDRGVTFSRFYASYPLCCPSRATFLSGQFMHNHQVRGNLAPNGGQHVFEANGTEGRSLPVWLSNAGYKTAHVGKYLNGYGDDGSPHVPAGWDQWYGQTSNYDPAEVGGRLYYDYDLLEKDMAGPPVLEHYGTTPAEYQGDVLINKALGAIDDLSATGDPFYLEFAPHAPHFPFVPPPRYAGTEAAAVLPKLAAMNEKDISDKPAFLRQGSPGKLKRATLASLYEDRVRRLEQLHAVDDYVGAIASRLAALGELDNTYLVFVSDNGYFLGEHRIIAGKYLPYEPSSRVPFAIAGPGLPAGQTSAELASNADFAPTIAALAGATPTLTVDGRSLLPFAVNPALKSGRPVLLEGDVGPGTGTRRFSARRLPGGLSATGDRVRPGTLAQLGLLGRASVPDLEQEPGAQPQRLALNGDAGPAYKSIRTNRWFLNVYNTGEIELYDMRRDPEQLANLRGRRYKKVKRVLMRRLVVLAACSGQSCSWSYPKDPKDPLRKKKGKRKGNDAKGGRKPGKRPGPGK